MSLIQNINYLARNLSTLEEAKGLLTPKAIKAMEAALGLPLQAVVEDLKKGTTPDGKRKLDIDVHVNSLGDPSSVLYSAVTITGSVNRQALRVEFEKPTFHLDEILEEILAAIEAYNVLVVSKELSQITNIAAEIQQSESVCGSSWILRITDKDPQAGETVLSSVQLHTVTSSTYAAEPDPVYNWYKSSSALLLMSTIEERDNMQEYYYQEWLEYMHITSQEHSAQWLEYVHTVTQERTQEWEAWLGVQGYIDRGVYFSGMVIESYSEIFSHEGIAYRLKPSEKLPTQLKGELKDHLDKLVQTEFIVSSTHYAEVRARQEADDNLQAQISGAAPLEASAFSPISWHKQEVQNSVTIPPQQNAWSFGPSMAIAEGQSVTIGENSHWTIAIS